MGGLELEGQGGFLGEEWQLGEFRLKELRAPDARGPQAGVGGAERWEGAY